MLETSRNTNGSMHPISGSTYATQSDIKALVRDAQSMLTAAASLTGEKAEELRARGMKLLDQAMGGASLLPTQAVEKGKELAHTADVYVKDHPWRTMVIAGGVGVLIGVLLSRKH
ncbi:DUF883 family protein [Telluria beijingensis]|uniref:DUF883 family protein n=1 Tax=Telluria beijingensis TaxID=3068633 RepID=UPI002795262F|nr:DUF883 family protein [Massilia sp. REN29]